MQHFKSLLIVVFALMLNAAAYAQENAGNPQPVEFVWERDTMAAFTKALEDTKPLVLLFGHPQEFRSSDGRNLTNEILKEFNHPDVIALRGRAVFAFGLVNEDEFARRVAVRLKLTDFPSICVIAPRSDAITETYRMEGLFKTAEIAADLDKALPRAKVAQAAAAPAIPAAPAPQPAQATPAGQAGLSDADKKAIDAAVNAYGAAMMAGDFEKITRLTSQPFGHFYEQGFPLARELGKAKRAILAAMDARFGAKEDTIPHGPDDDRIRKEMARLKSLFVLEYDTATGKIVTLQVEATMQDGKTEQWKFVANRSPITDEGWTLWPKTASGISAVGTSEAWQASMKKLSTAYHALAADITAGKLESREKALQAAFEAFSRSFSSTFGADRLPK